MYSTLKKPTGIVFKLIKPYRELMGVLLPDKKHPGFSQ
jgi:hypothetical protein